MENKLFTCLLKLDRSGWVGLSKFIGIVSLVGNIALCGCACQESFQIINTTDDYLEVQVEFGFSGYSLERCNAWQFRFAMDPQSEWDSKAARSTDRLRGVSHDLNGMSVFRVRSDTARYAKWQEYSIPTRRRNSVKVQSTEIDEYAIYIKNDEGIWKEVAKYMRDYMEELMSR